MSGYIDLFDPLNQNSDSQFFTWENSLSYQDADGHLNHVSGVGMFNDTGTEDTAFNAFKFSYASGNILIGSATLYGRKI